MFVPYGDPRPPVTFKADFNIGDDGTGVNANNLQMGCDRLDTIKYCGCWHNTSLGESLRLPNIDYGHEQDDGTCGSTSISVLAMPSLHDLEFLPCKLLLQSAITSISSLFILVRMPRFITKCVLQAFFLHYQLTLVKQCCLRR